MKYISLRKGFNPFKNYLNVLSNSKPKTKYLKNAQVYLNYENDFKMHKQRLFKKTN